MPDSAPRTIRRLARSFGVQTAYYDVARRRRQASLETLERLVSVFAGEDYGDLDPAALLAEVDRRRSRRVLEPVLIAWNGALEPLELHLPERDAGKSIKFTLELEDGARRTWDGASIIDALPTGYHRLLVEWGDQQRASLIVSAPRTMYEADPDQQGRAWGLFAPLYALHSESSWGAGNFTDLEKFWRWTVEQGGGLTATLPLLAVFLGDQPYDPSPYAPLSRLFWNEFYVDATRAPEFARCEPAQRLLASADARREIEALRSLERVDYRRQMQLQRRVLELLARSFEEGPSDRKTALADFVRARPEVEDYARFRAVSEQRRQGWSAWPQALAGGAIQAEDYRQDVYEYHRYAQWTAHQQVAALGETLSGAGPGLYLDLPLGVHRDGFDTWRHRASFALGAAGGAPPDAVFTKGQNWGFAPLHPERLREAGYGYLIACLRHHLENCGMLRIDHAMGLHRLYWIPDGCDARQGAYVQYRADEIYALLSVESHRNRAVIVAENLGTVPRFVNSSLKRHAVRTMYVAQYELNPRRRPALKRPARRSIASHNTHDMPTFAAFWQGLDLDDLFALGLFNDEEIQVERLNRQAGKQALVALLKKSGHLSGGEEAAEVFAALSAWLAESPAEIALLNLEDLWGELEPQNVPGTAEERPNWTHRAKLSLEAAAQNPELAKLLRQVTHLRNS